MGLKYLDLRRDDGQHIEAVEATGLNRLRAMERASKAFGHGERLGGQSTLGREQGMTERFLGLGSCCFTKHGPQNLKVVVIRMDIGLWWWL